ncbi:putative UDP-glucuronate:xylan alpha-glucuronosyltransferase 5 [Tripterygium wilfordii]|uniref:putative UDP-glucuronate:xylan alpha-glucuronosyltransferase 5 n=1 Tax=Tripterygium wilfordii TaxID=458696 RepID=UPI0018F812B0|nr:putative UDP-glucuronate:xylan alpha-glucuronosyltransferase 5 [Tripterygium wilfordii]
MAEPTQKIKVGMVNMDTRTIFEAKHSVKQNGAVEIVPVRFARVATKKWEDFFPEWIDEEKWSPPSCPEIPLPSRMEEEYGDLDVIVVQVPCGARRRVGSRDVFRLQVNLVVANLAVAGGVDRTVYIVFVGSCGPMIEIFRCDDLLTHVGDFWVYKPDLRRLRQKVLMPVGSCKIAPLLLGETGKQVSMTQSRQLWNLNYSTNHQREAYVTVLHSSEDYVCGAIALAQSIIKSNSTKDLVLLHDKLITVKSVEGLRAAGWKTRLIERIRSPLAKKGSYNEYNYSKLRIWQLIDYDKLIFIDSDIIVLKNIDKLFTYPQLSASPNDKFLFNSGIIVLEPSLRTFDYLMSKIPRLDSYNGGDQGFLNEAFTWWHRLPTKLNYLKIFERSKNNEDNEIPSDVHTIHYLGWKPWMCYRDYDCNWDMKDRHIFASDSAHKIWWQVYGLFMPKELQQFCALSKEDDARIKKHRKRAKTANLQDGHWRIIVQDPRKDN